MVLAPHEVLEHGAVLVADLVLVALQEGEQGLVPHHRHLPGVARESSEVIHQRVNLRPVTATLLPTTTCW